MRFFGLVAGRLIPIAGKWDDFNRDFTEFRQAAHKIERGARVLSVRLGYDSDLWPRPEVVASSTYWHIISLAVIDRSVFTPLLFTNRAAQPVRAGPTVAHLDLPYGSPVWPRALVVGADPALRGNRDGKTGRVPRRHSTTRRRNTRKCAIRVSSS